MSKVRSFQRKMQPRPVEQLGPVNTDPLAGQNYRVRRLIIKAEVDVYTPEGVMMQRGLTDDVALNESEFPQDLMAHFINKGMLKEGFKTYKPAPHPPGEVVKP